MESGRVFQDVMRFAGKEPQGEKRARRKSTQEKRREGSLWSGWQKCLILLDIFPRRLIICRQCVEASRSRPVRVALS